jgi:hypothetical protein
MKHLVTALLAQTSYRIMHDEGQNREAFPATERYVTALFDPSLGDPMVASLMSAEQTASTLPEILGLASTGYVGRESRCRNRVKFMAEEVKAC